MTAPTARPDRGGSRPLWLYSLVWWLATPALLMSLVWRGFRQPGYRHAIRERFGYGTARKGTQPLLWLHAVSVGETRAAEPLVRALAARWPDASILLTHMTPTGRNTGAAVFADLIAAGRLEQCWLPWDYPGAMRRLLRRTRPSLGILMETELWPNLMAAASQAAVPIVLVSARLSEKSLRKGLRWRALIEPALQSLAQVFAQTPSDAERLARLGRTGVPVLGNLKFDIPPPAPMLALGGHWRKCLLSVNARRGVIVVASTRESEEAMLFDAWHRQIATIRADERPLLVVVPRHPQRFDEVTALAQSRGWRVARRSQFAADPSGSDQTGSDHAGYVQTGSDQPGPDAANADVLIGDSMGEMFAWYALADIAIIGGAFAPLGGQNLIEACAVGRPLVFGPHMFNFQEISRDAIAAGAAVQVADAAQALGTALALLADAPQRAAMAQAAKGFAAQHRGATERTLEAIDHLLR